MQRQRQPPVRDRWMLLEPKQFLNSYRERWRARSLIVDGVAVACGGFKMSWRFGFQALLQIPRQKRLERLAQIIGTNVCEPCLAG